MRLIATSEGLANVPAAAAATPANQERRGWLKKLGAALGLGLLAGPAATAASQGARGTLGVTGSEDYIGEIMLFAGNFQVKNYMFCDGRILSIQNNEALYSLLGTTYGGNGQSTFGLPDLRGRVPMHFGQGPGLSSYSYGQVGGQEAVTLTTNQLPAHTHALNVAAGAATTATATGNFPAAAAGQTAGGENLQVNSFNTAGGATANAAAISPAGGNQPLPIMQPYLVMNYQICVRGIYPSRD